MTLFTTRGALGCFPFLVAGLVACVPVDASREITLMSDATATLSDETLTKLKPQIDAYKAAAPDRAAAAGDLWLLSQACDTNEEVFNYDALSNCRIDRVKNETAPEPAPTQLQAVQRKLGLLSEYSALLSDLASAQTEADIKIAYAGLADTLKGLGEKSGSSGIASFAQSLQDEKEKVGAVTDFAVSSYRNRLLKRTVRDADPLIIEVTGELKATLQDLNLDTGYAAALTRMRNANTEAFDANLAGNTARTAAAYRELEASHAAFIKAAEGSVYTKLDQLAATHNGLAARLSGSPSTEALTAYLKALRDLAGTLEG